MTHHDVCRMNCGLTPSRETLTRNHGTPAGFAKAVWAACDQLFITQEEAARAIDDYAREWHAAPTEIGNEM